MTNDEITIVRAEHDQKMLIELERLLRVKNRYITNPAIKALGSSKNLDTNYKNIKNFLEDPNIDGETEIITEFNILGEKLKKTTCTPEELITADSIKYYAMPMSVRRAAKKRGVLRPLPNMTKDELSDTDLRRIKQIFSRADTTVVRYRVLEAYGKERLEKLLSQEIGQDVKIEILYDSRPSFYVHVATYACAAYRMAIPEIPVVRISVAKREKAIDRIQIA